VLIKIKIGVEIAIAIGIESISGVFDGWPV